MAAAAWARRGAARSAAAGKSRRGWFVLGGIVILALLVGIVAAGGRLSDGVGVALTLLAVVFVVALVIAAVKPAVLARWFPGASPRALLVTCGAVAAGCFVFAAVLWWMPHYEVIAPTDKRIALDDKPDIKVLVVNRGLLGGTYSAAYAVDGDQQDAVAFPLGGGDGRELTLSLPSGVERGDVLLSLGGASSRPRRWRHRRSRSRRSRSTLRRRSWATRSSSPPRSRTPVTSAARSAVRSSSTARNC